MQLNPYLNFDGRCAEAFAFYADLFGGTVDSFPYAGTPAAEQMPAEWRDKIMHATLRAGDMCLMGADLPPGMFTKSQGMSVSLQVDGPAEGRRIFDRLAEGGSVTMPFEKTFWSAGFGMVIDRFGTPWMVNCVQDG